MFHTFKPSSLLLLAAYPFSVSNLLHFIESPNPQPYEAGEEVFVKIHMDPSVYGQAAFVQYRLVGPDKTELTTINADPLEWWNTALTMSTPGRYALVFEIHAKGSQPPDDINILEDSSVQFVIVSKMEDFAIQQ
ncbi:hypothetical protein NEOLI_001426 [Neolecta irregularis DAH-3]|uniref:Uncharacterized protein n=1 Tax=Neolecta irregularis (strain DAH-3) TaxID=1198029 RepID=A0A1U7LG85_NEOID|nr:hypothetical protein NEOLI_001426 [Neolecta irregularis DAH-3]|eukprot:OLL21657.1 hypothetical protein NEOLI_001426 [Neolecta irregularis DAH-3]